jgi:hypothetical protein
LATDILLQCGRDTVEWKSISMFFMQIEQSARARSALTTADDIGASIPARISDNGETDRKQCPRIGRSIAIYMTFVSDILKPNARTKETKYLNCLGLQSRLGSESYQDDYLDIRILRYTP